MMVTERRRHPRKIGEGLIVLIDGQIYPLVNISVSGVSFQGDGYHGGQRVTLTIARLTDMSDCVEARITVVTTTDSVTHGEFLTTMALMRFVILHMGEITGAAPAFFK